MVHLFYRLSVFILFLFLFVSPGWSWERTISSPKDVDGKALAITEKGNVIVVGSTTSPSFGMKDVYIAKFTSGGKTVWSRHYGGFFDDCAEDLYVDKDNIYVLATVYSFGSGCSDVALLRYGYMGKKREIHTYGTTYCEMGKAFVRTDKGFVILAKEKDKTSSYLLCLNKNFRLERKIPLSSLEYPEGLLYKKGVGFFVFGGTHDFDHDFKIGGYILFFDTNLNKIWEKVLGDETEYFLKSASWTDYGILIGGFSGLSLYNFWSPLVIKVDLAGNVEYEKTYEEEESSGVVSLIYKNGKGYGVGFEKRGGRFHPAFFDNLGEEKINTKVLPYIGELSGLKIFAGRRYYTGYIIKKEKREIIIGTY